MTWGTFTVQHILSLAAIVAFAVSLHFILKRLSDKAKTRVLFAVSLIGVAAVLYDLVRWGQPLLYLPLHLCSLNALIIPFAVLTKNKVAAHLTLVWSLGAMLVLIVNTGQAYYEMFSEAFWVFVLCHTVDVTVPALLFTTGLVEFNIKKAPAVIGTTMAAYTCVHFINIGINKYLANQAASLALYARSRAAIPQVNYMYSLGDEGNAAFAFFKKIIPYDYWHMYLIAPIIAAFLFAVHFGIKLRRKRKAKKENITVKTEALQ
ncbi:MAG: YwaF family protein [Clostridia bacterium]|nr:YwaF family protein [Clostridia bacterium]